MHLEVLALKEVELLLLVVVGECGLVAGSLTLALRGATGEGSSAGS